MIGLNAFKWKYFKNKVLIFPKYNVTYFDIPVVQSYLITYSKYYEILFFVSKHVHKVSIEFQKSVT